MSMSPASNPAAAATAPDLEAPNDQKVQRLATNEPAKVGGPGEINAGSNGALSLKSRPAVGTGTGTQPVTGKEKEETEKQKETERKCIVDAAQNINYLDPTSFGQLNTDLQTVMVVAGLLIGGTYQGVANGYSTDPPPLGAPSSYDPKVATFCTLNHVGFGLAVVAVFLAVTGVILLQKLRRWPDGSGDIPDPPPAISSQYVDAAAFAKVEKCVKSLNFVWNAHNYGLLRPSLRKSIQLAFSLAWASLLVSLTLTLAAAAVALDSQVNGRRGIFGGVVGVIGGACFLISIIPPFAAMSRNKENVYMKPKVHGESRRSIQPNASGGSDVSSTETTTAVEAPSVPLTGDQAAGAKVLEMNWWSTKLIEHTVCNFTMRGSADMKTKIWYDAMDLARKLDPQIKIVSRAAADLQARLEDDHSSKIAPIMDRLSAWKEQHGPHYAVHVFRDPKLLPDALQYTRTLWAFWKQLDQDIEIGDFTLEDFFSTRSYGAVWLGRAKEYRELAEQLDIVNWYYKNKHIEYASHYCDNLANAAGLEEYYSNPAIIAGQPDIPKKRARNPEFGVYEEWLVKGSNCRPDRYRLIQEWEARLKLYNVNTGRYTSANLNTEKGVDGELIKPQSSLELALLLRQHLGTGKDKGIKFQETANWPEQLKNILGVGTGVTSGVQGGAAPGGTPTMEELLAHLEMLVKAMQEQRS